MKTRMVVGSALVLLFGVGYLFGPPVVEMVRIFADIQEYIETAERAESHDKTILEISDIAFTDESSGSENKVNISGINYKVIKTSDFAKAITITNAQEIYLYNNEKTMIGKKINALCFSANKSTICLPLLKQT